MFFTDYSKGLRVSEIFYIRGIQRFLLPWATPKEAEMFWTTPAHHLLELYDELRLP